MGLVYFIRCGNSDFFKVGVTTEGTHKRVASLQVGNPYKLTVYGFIETETPYSLESSLHSILQRAGCEQIRGEWFEADEYIIRLLLDTNFFYELNVNRENNKTIHRKLLRFSIGLKAVNQDLAKEKKGEMSTRELWRRTTQTHLKGFDIIGA